MKVYIDGENFRKGIARVLKSEGKIKSERDLESYPLQLLLEDILGTKDFSVNYYASKIKLPNGYTPSSGILRQVAIIKEFSRKWVPMLEAQGIQYIKAGAIKVKSSKKCGKCGNIQDILQEKGVDVRIAVDILDDVFNNNENVVVLMSSDTDLCPSLHKARSKDARVVYVCYADALNRAVSAVANETITISANKICKYLPEKRI